MHVYAYLNIGLDLEGVEGQDAAVFDVNISP